MSGSGSMAAIVTGALGFLAILILLGGLFAAGHKVAAVVLLAVFLLLVTLLIVWGCWILDNIPDLRF